MIRHFGVICATKLVTLVNVLNSFYRIKAASCLLGAFLVVQSCKHENMQVYPDDFAIYVDEFFIQASVRGKDIYANHFDFSIQFGEPAVEGAAAVCNTIRRDITVDPAQWERMDDRERERLIFHELGHCILGRDHKNKESVNGECYSYMRGAEDDFDCSINHYSDYWRQYYIDELFDENIPLPAWYVDNMDYGKTNLNFTHSFTMLDTLVDELELDDFFFRQKDTFLFEITYYNHDTEEKNVLLNFGDLKFAHCDVCSLVKTRLLIDQNEIYNSADVEVGTDITFTIFRDDDVVSFFVNGIFVHAMEFNAIKGHLIRTKRFENPMQMSVRYLYN